MLQYCLTIKDVALYVGVPGRPAWVLAQFRLVFGTCSPEIKTHPKLVELIVRPRAAGLLTGVEFSRVRDSAWICFTPYVTTRIVVGLVDRKGIYPNASE